MALRARTFTTVNDLATFMESEGIGKDAIYFQQTNLSGGHDIVFNDSQSGSSSLKAGSTAAERAIYGTSGIDKPLDATQITAAGGRTFTFDAAAGTLTLSTGDVLADGYEEGMAITVASTTSNNGTFLIGSLTATVITIDADADTDLYSVAFVDEGPLSATATLDGSQAGREVNGASFIHVVVKLPDTGTSLEWQLYTYDSTSEEWTLDTRPGTDGTVAVTEAGDDNPHRTIIEAGGVERVALVIQSSAGTFTTGYSAWLLSAD